MGTAALARLLGTLRARDPTARLGTEYAVLTGTEPPLYSPTSLWGC